MHYKNQTKQTTKPKYLIYSTYIRLSAVSCFYLRLKFTQTIHKTFIWYGGGGDDILL